MSACVAAYVILGFSGDRWYGIILVSNMASWGLVTCVIQSAKMKMSRNEFQSTFIVALLPVLCLSLRAVYLEEGFSGILLLTPVMSSFIMTIHFGIGGILCWSCLFVKAKFTHKPRA